MKKIFLLADDDDDDKQLFCEALEAVDPSVVCNMAADGREALSILSRQLPHLIFLDVNMPVMNGWDCLKAIKQQDAYKYIPVLMYSTSSSQKDVDKALDLGALCFFTKPDNFIELKSILEVTAVHVHADLLQAISRFNQIKSRHIFACTDKESKSA